MADGDPTVSVVIPTHNREHLICDALDSVQAQSFRDLEIIVVDDGSTDGTRQRVAQWSEASELAVRYAGQPQSGGNAARNKGIGKARGRYVAFLDSDDLWHPDKLRKQVELLEARPGYGAAYTGLRETDAESGAVISEPRHAYPEGDLLNDLLVSDVTAPTSAWIARRALFQKAGGFDQGLMARQDWDMWIRLAQCAKIGCVPEALVDLRHHSGPRTVSDPARELAAYRRILEKYAPLRRQRGLRVRLAALSSYHRRAGRVHLHYLNRRGRAIGHYLMALALWPLAADTWAALLGAFLPATLRRQLRTRWNAIFGGTALAIRSH
ncbi:glycosyltransferase family 2 protein [Leisingera sp. McT4-56]|uniref:glycosyltransferase family 2 protein n=1 Tax=Leisingera sp. McT4-56 TaxID=2881255 RepID=UPI001CF89245|nr:glycosyltransferase family 2 protein [Leisingera sp. McT4-56]MCB4458428.1 glycosyltransferase family 2 protein [Leisingera sp. McT4-56]